jgi:branched-chain amino acid transport system substrate-binding protein
MVGVVSMNPRRFPLSSLLLSAAFFSAIAWQAFVPLQAEAQVTIVSSLPKTGSANAQSTSITNGIRLALKEVNNRAGNTTIAYQDWDDASPARGAWDPAVEAANADKAIQDASVVAYIGPYNSGAAKISMPKLNQAGLLMVSPAASWPGLTKPGLGEPNEPAIYRPSGKINFFRVVPADDLQGDVAAQWAKDLGGTSAYVLHDGELYGKGVASIFKKGAEKRGITVLNFEKIDPKASNFRSLAFKIKQQKPDIVYFGGTTQTGAGQLIKDLRAAGVTSKFMAPDGCYETAFIEAAGHEAVEGSTYITFGGVPANQLTGKGKEFYDSYKATYGDEPEGYAAYGYEAAKVVIAAIEKSSTKDRAGVIAALSNTKDYQGALGTWSFDAQGDTTLRTMSGNVIKSGKFELAKVLE